MLITKIMSKDRLDAENGANGGGHDNQQGDEGIETKQTNPTGNNLETQQEKKPAKKKEERLFTRAELAQIVKDESEKAVSEAEKLRKMNASERATYELAQEKEQAEKQLQDTLAELAEEKKKNSWNELSLEATSMLQKESIQTSQSVLAFVVKDTAEATKEAVEEFVSLVDHVATEKVKAELTGKTPAINLTPGKQLSKKEIMSIKDRDERQAAVKIHFSILVIYYIRSL